jgi:hypothetical protein
MSISLLLRVESVEVRGNFKADHHWLICEVQGLVHDVTCFCDFWRIGNEVLKEEVCTSEYSRESATRHMKRQYQVLRMQVCHSGCHGPRLKLPFENDRNVFVDISSLHISRRMSPSSHLE